MNLETLKNEAQSHAFNQFRTYAEGDFRNEFRKLNFAKKNAEIFNYMCNCEFPIVKSGERIPFARSKRNIPYYFERKDLIHEYGGDKYTYFDTPHNLTPNYSLLLKYGINGLKKLYQNKSSEDNQHSNFYNNVIYSLNSVNELVE